MIDMSGKWWKGGSAEDLNEYLRILSEDSYPVNEFRLALCPCGSDKFLLEVKDEEEAGKCICSACSKARFVCDSEESWKGRSRKFKCIECKGKEANIGIGFSLYDDLSAVRWVYVGCRCPVCGVLGCMIDWKIDYAPSLQFLEQG
jgi:hypothetical protein